MDVDSSFSLRVTPAPTRPPGTVPDFENPPPSTHLPGPPSHASHPPLTPTVHAVPCQARGPAESPKRHHRVFSLPLPAPHAHTPSLQVPPARARSTWLSCCLSVCSRPLPKAAVFRTSSCPAHSPPDPDDIAPPPVRATPLKLQSAHDPQPPQVYHPPPSCLSQPALAEGASPAVRRRPTCGSWSTSTSPTCKSWIPYASFHQLDRTGSG